MATQKWNRDAELAAELRDTIQAERVRKQRKPGYLETQRPPLPGATVLRYCPQRMSKQREHTR